MTVNVTDADPRLRPGLSANVAILLDQMKDVTYVPVEAIFDENGKTVAYVKRGRKPKRVIVECGAANDKFVVIKNGLQAGDKICLGQPS